MDGSVTFGRSNFYRLAVVGVMVVGLAASSMALPASGGVTDDHDSVRLAEEVEGSVFELIGRGDLPPLGELRHHRALTDEGMSGEVWEYEHGVRGTYEEPTDSPGPLSTCTVEYTVWTPYRHWSVPGAPIYTHGYLSLSNGCSGRMSGVRLEYRNQAFLWITAASTGDQWHPSGTARTYTVSAPCRSRIHRTLPRNGGVGHQGPTAQFSC